MTVGEIIKKGRAELEKAQVPDAAVDILWIVGAVTRYNRVQLSINRDIILSEEMVQKIQEYIERRKKREPLQYILGSQYFMNIKLKTDRRALIPRSETEILAQQAITLIRKDYPRFSPFYLLDIGTGTGAIALSIAHSCTNVYATAVDISADALDLAKENAKLNQLEDRVEFLQSDLFSALEGKKFHGIVSNPPYIPTHTIDSLMPEVAQYEPHIALDGGEFGFDFYEKIISCAGEYLYDGGFLALEASHFQFFPIADRLAEQKGFGPINLVADYSGSHRVCWVKYKA